MKGWKKIVTALCTFFFIVIIYKGFEAEYKNPFQVNRPSSNVQKGVSTVLEATSIMNIDYENYFPYDDKYDENYFPYDEKCLFKNFPKYNPSNDVQNFSFLKTDEGQKYKTILFHNGYIKGDFAFSLGHKSFEAACCKEKRCFLTTNREEIPIQEFDAILFDYRSLKNVKLPKKRKKNQRWIFFEREPPPQTPNDPQKFNGVFNWTMTYRRDSDVIAPYGRVYPKSLFSNQAFNFSKLTRNISFESLMKTKTKMAAWFVSHCHTHSRRESYVRKLKEYIQVDVYGKCGKLVCDKFATRSPKCYEMAERNYKFYLSFENSLCNDYVTEKFYNILNYNVIPVVRGSGDFAAIAPPYSYIDVRDFKRIKDLAGYLKYLDRNDTAYMEYFEWRKTFIFLSGNAIFHKGSLCALCSKLHNNTEEKIVHNLKNWFMDKADCKQYRIK